MFIHVRKIDGLKSKTILIIHELILRMFIIREKSNLDLRPLKYHILIRIGYSNKTDHNIERLMALFRHSEYLNGGSIEKYIGIFGLIHKRIPIISFPVRRSSFC